MVGGWCRAQPRCPVIAKVAGRRGLVGVQCDVAALAPMDSPSTPLPVAPGANHDQEGSREQFVDVCRSVIDADVLVRRLSEA